MSDINSVVLVGRVTRDLDERGYSVLPSGTAKLSLSIAVNKSVKKGDEWVDEPSYFDIVFFGKGAEGLKPYIRKGSQIAVEGYLKQDRWEKDGVKMSRVQVVANNIRLVGGRQDNQSSPSPKAAASAPAPTAADNGGFPEDIPF